MNPANLQEATKQLTPQVSGLWHAYSTNSTGCFCCMLTVHKVLAVGAKKTSHFHVSLKTLLQDQICLYPGKFIPEFQIGLCACRET